MDHRVKFYIKAMASCTSCPHFCDEGGWCTQADNNRRIVDNPKPIPEWCSLPDDGVKYMYDVSRKLLNLN